ncbi:hypothetical protein MICRO8M_80578 [Microbacterium sp. 8M]|nr:hypothetical protein MICRO8M_80578 [Microbacterium sp. 8M]
MRPDRGEAGHQADPHARAGHGQHDLEVVRADRDLERVTGGGERVDHDCVHGVARRRGEHPPLVVQRQQRGDVDRGARCERMAHRERQKERIPVHLDRRHGGAERECVPGNRVDQRGIDLAAVAAIHERGHLLEHHVELDPLIVQPQHDGGQQLRRRGEGSEAQPRPAGLGQLPGIGDRALTEGEDLLRPLQQKHPHRCQPTPPRRAHQHLGADQALQILEVIVDRGLPPAEPARGRRDGSFGVDRSECLELTEIDHETPTSYVDPASEKH